MTHHFLRPGYSLGCAVGLFLSACASQLDASDQADIAAAETLALASSDAARNTLSEAVQQLAKRWSASPAHWLADQQRLRDRAPGHGRVLRDIQTISTALASLRDRPIEPDKLRRQPPAVITALLKRLEVLLGAPPPIPVPTINTIEEVTAAIAAAKRAFQDFAHTAHWSPDLNAATANHHPALGMLRRAGLTLLNAETALEKAHTQRLNLLSPEAASDLVRVAQTLDTFCAQLTPYNMQDAFGAARSDHLVHLAWLQRLAQHHVTP